MHPANGKWLWMYAVKNDIEMLRLFLYIMINPFSASNYHRYNCYVRHLFNFEYLREYILRHKQYQSSLKISHIHL